MVTKKENKKNKTPKYYLRQVNLDGYKSINNVRSNFHNDINIIIGQNSVGKSNFIRFIYDVLRGDFNTFSKFYAKFLFKDELSSKTSISIEYENDPELLETENELKIPNNLDFSYKIKDKKHEIKEINSYKELAEVGETKDDKYKLNENIFENINFRFICHGLPAKMPFIDQPFSFEIGEKEPIPQKFFEVFEQKEVPDFIKALLFQFSLRFSFKDRNFNEEKIKNEIHKSFSSYKNLFEILREQSPVKEVRVSDNLNIFYNKENKTISVNNFFLEFKVSNQWLNYNNLSDGTKRLIYIIFELVMPTSIDFKSNEQVKSISFYEGRRGVFFLEEPELGLHPFQLQKLLRFIKTISEQNQVIITTHSPEVLDILENDELNRIILAKKRGSKTTIRHLNQNEIKKAQAYMEEEAFLSDYWKHSDLEN